MPFILQCPREDCRKFMLVEDSDRGKAIECLVCHRMFQATVASPPSSQAARQPQAAPSGRSQPGPGLVRPNPPAVTWPNGSESTAGASGGSRVAPTRPAVPQAGAFTPPTFTPPPVAPAGPTTPPGRTSGGPSPASEKVVRVCPQCQTSLSVPDMPGKKIRCPRCSTIF